jgi:hypothetical protein
MIPIITGDHIRRTPLAANIVARLRTSVPKREYLTTAVMRAVVDPIKPRHALKGDVGGPVQSLPVVRDWPQNEDLASFQLGIAT